LTAPVATLVAAVVGLTSTLVTFIFTGRRAGRADGARREHEIEMARLSAETKTEDARREALRLAVAEYSAAAVRQVDAATSLAADPTLVATRLQLEGSHTELRSQYEALRLLSNSKPVQSAAREVLRVAWNERQEGLGRPRKRPRIPADIAPAKYLRKRMHVLILETRRELGLSDELIDEPEDD
jgi:hypothetical protein